MGKRQKTIQSRPRVNIRLDVSILSVLRLLNYRPWFAVAKHHGALDRMER